MNMTFRQMEILVAAAEAASMEAPLTVTKRGALVYGRRRAGAATR